FSLCRTHLLDPHSFPTRRSSDLRACEVLYSGKTACFAPFGLPMLWLVHNYDIDIIFASTQQALALAEIQEKITHYPLRSLKALRDRKSTRLNSSHRTISYAVFCL